MNVSPRYTVLGDGRWARVLVDVLAQMDRRATTVAAVRQRSGEDDDAYRKRLRDSLAEAGDIVWVSVPPGPQSVVMVEAALDAGQHVIVEKPWPASPAQSSRLETRATNLGLRCAVHFQYPFLDAVQSLRQCVGDGAGVVLSGQFTIARASHNGIPASQNLGSHLLAIWRMVFPQSELGSMIVGYERENCRMLRLEGHEVSHIIDFTHNFEPIIQRFVAAFEAGGSTLAGLTLAAEIGGRAKCL